MSDRRRSAESDSGGLSQGWGVQRPSGGPENPSAARTGASAPISPELAGAVERVTARTGETSVAQVRRAVAQQIADVILADVDPLFASRTHADLWEAAYRAARIALQIGADHA